MERLFGQKEQNDFKKSAYFSKGDTVLVMSINEASQRAYRDLCRTLSKVGEFGGEARRLKIDNLIEEGIKELIDSGASYDNWHQKVCKEMIKIYEGYSKFTYGHAQKWLNMAMKYLIIYADDTTYKGLEPFAGDLHIPVDSYIFKAARDKVGFPYKKGERGKGAKFVDHPQWKSISDYRWSQLSEREYDYYQTELKNAVKNQTGKKPILWEFEAWYEAWKAINGKK